MENNSNIEPRLQTGCAQPYVAIAISVTTAQWHLTCQLVPELTAWLDRKGVNISGALFYRYHVLGDDEVPFQLEVGFPITTPIEGDHRVISGTIPQGTFATLIHCGNRHDIERSYTALQHWADEQGLQWKKHQGNEQEQWAGRFEFCLDHPAMGTHDGHKRIAIAVLIEG